MTDDDGGLDDIWPQELPLWPREHDLPPRWDGLPVEWGEWQDTAQIVICPPLKRKDRCGHCKGVSAPLINLGRIYTDPATAPRAISRGRLRDGKHIVAVISAFRCPDCRRDYVLDDENRMWDLDQTDYTDDGSWETAAQ